MKTLKFIALALVITFALSCKNKNDQPEVKTVEVETEASQNELDPNAKYAKAEFTVEGMTCAIGCAKTIEKNIAKMDGVKSAKVDFDKKLAMVEFDEAKVTTKDLEATVKKTGDTYSVKDMKTVNDFGFENNTQEQPEDEKAEGMHKTVSCKPGCKMNCCSKEAKA